MRVALVVPLLICAALALPGNGASQPSASELSTWQVALLQQAKQGDSPKQVDWSVFLPSGKGQMQVGSYCSTCHDLKTVVSDRRADAEGWKSIVEDMVLSKGAPAPEEDIPVMAAYLAQYFGPSTPKLAPPVGINTAPKELLALLPGLAAEDVQKILDARKNGPIKDASSLEAIVGKDKAKGIKDVISFDEESKKS